MTSFAARLDELQTPIWIVLAILGFIFWWPLGLVILAYTLWSGKMGCCGIGFGRWRDDTSRRAQDWWRRAANQRQPSLRRIPSRDACGAWKRSSTNFGNFSRACGWPRTRPSSTSSWPKVAPGKSRVRRSQAFVDLIKASWSEAVRINSIFLETKGATYEVRLHSRGPLRHQHARKRRKGWLPGSRAPIDATTSTEWCFNCSGSVRA